LSTTGGVHVPSSTTEHHRPATIASYELLHVMLLIYAIHVLDG